MNIHLFRRRLGIRFRRRGDAARAAGCWSAAAAAYQRYLDYVPSDPAIWIQLGHMRAHAGDHGTAETAYAAAQALTPQDPDLLLCRGHLRKMTGDIDGARAFYAASAMIDGNADAVRERDQLHPASGQADDAPLARMAEIVVLKPFVRFSRREIALFVTHAPAGILKPHVASYIRTLRDQHITVLLVVAADRPFRIAPDVLDMLDGAIIRRNVGYDFAAWGHVLSLYPDLYGASMLFLVNDSMTAPAGGGQFGAMIDRIRSAPHDLIALTESQEYRWHVQSYFLAFKPAALSSPAIQNFFSEVRSLATKDDVVRTYETRLAALAQHSGLRVGVLFDSAIALNPTLHDWRHLLAIDFPFVKILLLRSVFPDADITGWQSFLRSHSFDLDLVDTTIRAAAQSVPDDGESALLTDPMPPASRDAASIRIGFYGPLQDVCAAGDLARAMIAGIRRCCRSGWTLNLHSILTSGSVQRLTGPQGDIMDSAGVADIAILALDDDGWQGLTPLQQEAVRGAGRCIGYSLSADPGQLAGIELVDRIWCLGTAADWSGPVDRLADPRSALNELKALGDVAYGNIPGVTIDAVPSPNILDRIACQIRQSLTATYEGRKRVSSASRLFSRPDAGWSATGGPLGPYVQVVMLNSDGSPIDRTLTDAASAMPWTAFIPDGAMLAPHFADALLSCACARPDIAIFYPDDIAYGAPRDLDQIRLKPDFDITLLTAQDYIGPAIIVRSSILNEIPGPDAAQHTTAIADFVFRTHAAGKGIARMADVLVAYLADRPRARDEAYRSMLTSQRHMTGRHIIPGLVPRTFAQMRSFDAGDAPPVTILIPTCGALTADGLMTCIERLLDGLERTDWPMDRLTVMVGDDCPAPGRWVERSRPYRLVRIPMPRDPDIPFNYAAKMNLLWRQAPTEQLVFMNDDIVVTNPDWLSALQTFAGDRDVGGVGGRLLFEDGRLQHAGMAPHGFGTAHLWVGSPAEAATYQDWAMVQREWSMVTGALFATRRSLMEEVDGFDERFSLEFNDTDLCLRLRLLGYRIIYTPYARMIHAEKTSRKDVLPPGQDLARFTMRWQHWLRNDPSWHPRLRRDRIEPEPERRKSDWF